MQQHTGQHVFSAVADLLLGADTASWELHPLEPAAHGGGDYGCVSVDLTVPSLTAEQVGACVFVRKHKGKGMCIMRASLFLSGKHQEGVV